MASKKNLATNGIKAAVSLPPQEEWDFRNVTEANFPVVAIYEYARSSKLVTDTWNAWLNSTIATLVPYVGPASLEPDTPLE